MAKSSSLPPLTWLRAFEATARHLSFTRAAAELNLTQSAVSQHVRSLEAFLGRDLFVRKTRALELTEDGSNYLPSLRDALDLIAASTQAFTGSDRGSSMTLQCNMAYSVFWLAPRLHRLYARHPWLVLNIVTPIWDPERHAASAAMEIRFGRPEDMDATAIRLSDEMFYPVCAPGFQAGRADLETATLFDCAGITGTWATWAKSAGVPFARQSEVNLTSTYVISINAALHGAGMTMAHGSLAQAFLRDGSLIRPYGHEAPLTESYFLFPPSSHAQTPASRAFQDWLSEELQTG
ncbi:MAG: LysR family transcriptional regulator [Paracoccaceae bacterium]|jgi:LysR family glycine cleavage system transcriptional activator|nr:LysR family transcriptional regulator [Paracoccaceae bacterium]MDP7185498.1 LysR family transcriptional regulator [Paracoccaceae bacterium]